MVKHSTRDAPLPPDEVLFRRAGAPQRYAEHDIYYANERQLGRGGRAGLPDSDLLKAVHSYASKFYAAQQREQQIFTTPGVPVGDAADPGEDERTMDETALLAFGILLEEESRQLLGRKGDMVFTEGAGEHDGDEGHEDEDEDGQAADDEQLDYGTREMLVGSTVGAPRRRKRLRAEANESGDATA